MNHDFENDVAMGFRCPKCGCEMNVDDKDLSFTVDGFEVEVSEVYLDCPNCGYSEEQYED